MNSALLTIVFLASAQLSETQPSPSPEAEGPEAQAVAEEIVRIREALGGSIVEVPQSRDGRPESRHHDHPRDPRPPKRHGPVALLRHTAMRLDMAAHRLEMATLYEDADRLRATAQSLRLSARELAARVGAANTPDRPQN